MIEPARILICQESQQENSDLAEKLESLGFRTLATTNPKAVVVLAREHRPKAIILVIPEPLALCHELKMNPQLYSIPLFVSQKSGDPSSELSFLANEILPYPVDIKLLAGALERYLKLEIGQERNTKTETKNRWIEVRSLSTYLFDYKGVITNERILNLKNRIAELLTVGRNSFIIKLTAAEQIDNLLPANLIALWKMVNQAGAEIRLVLPVSNLSSILVSQGIPVDEYLTSI